jgi:predicted nucleic acid-binding protein
MGPLNIPSSGAVYLDSNCIIHSVEKIEPYAGLLEPVWLASKSRRIEIVSSELSHVETLVRPIRERDALMEGLFRTVLRSRELRLVAMTLPLLDRAAHVRAETNLKTPDAIHAATAIEAGRSLFITNDPVFKRVVALSCTILGELTA